MTTSLASRIAALGSTKAEVAETLRQAGIRAIKGDPCCCAVALWVEQGGFRGVAVAKSDGGSFYIEALGAPDFVIGHTGPVPDFIRAFDASEYPELIAEAVR